MSSAGSSQVPREPVPALPAALRRALPAGYAVLDAASGDLNRDARPDWLVVLNKPDEAKTSDVAGHPTKRPLLLFVGGAGGTYTFDAALQAAPAAFRQHAAQLWQQHRDERPGE